MAEKWEIGLGVGIDEASSLDDLRTSIPKLIAKAKEQLKGTGLSIDLVQNFKESSIN